MKFSELIQGIEGSTLYGSSSCDVTGISYRSSDVQGGHCFVALRGLSKDGHDYIEDAVRRGAVCVVSERRAAEDGISANLVVKNSRYAMAKMASRFYHEPSSEMKLVGITGTNGKTTTSYMLESIFSECGMSPGVIGTIEYRFGGVREKASHTTPESVDLQRLFRRMRDLRVDACAMEVSSHALSQGRVLGCDFDVAVFTNLTPEHQDYHDGMEDYFEAKAALFEDVLESSRKENKAAVINVDDPYGVRLKKRCKAKIIDYGFSSHASVRGEDLKFGKGGFYMKVSSPASTFDIRSRLCGRFNAMNALAASSSALAIGIAPSVIARAIEKVERVPGRFELVENGAGIIAIVDYAHTPDALKNVLSHARELTRTSGGRLVVVFGCGGDRDRKKRPEMGRVAADLSDVAIVTSDNPRTERPESIIDEIVAGMKGRKYDVIANRKDAIAMAVEIAEEGDVIVVAGKGHEDYQIVGKERIHFDDRETLGEALSKKRI
jgi:UDP-N-acetylmuramoyl-L-alanyl-D-glutamate--2,6-diaminopimelate ligase